MGNIATASTKKNTKVFLLGEKNVTLKMFTFISNIKENYPILLLALKKKSKKKNNVMTEGSITQWYTFTDTIETGLISLVIQLFALALPMC